VSTDPAHSLGDVLRRPVGARVRRIHGVAALELDAEGALRRWLAPRRALLRLIGERGTYLDGADVDALLEAALPGLAELVALLELRRLADGGGFRRVVVDTAPTGHTLRLLDMPRTLVRVAGVLDTMQARHRALVSALARRYREDAADAVIAELERDASDTAALLRDPERTAFSWVLDAEDLALEEARDGVAALRERGIRVDEVVVNRLTARPPAPCALCDARRRAEARVARTAARALAPASLRLVTAREMEPRGPAALAPLARDLRARPRMPRGGRTGRPATIAAGAGPASWALRLAPPGLRLLMMAGKGGVGKTSAAAAAALELAADGRDVLLLSADPAHSLGDVLGVPLADAARPVPGAGRLRAREIDAMASYAARRERYGALVDELFSSAGARSGVDATYDHAVTRELLGLAPPGVDELFALAALASAVDEAAPAAERAELIVLDTAPTGHALRLLALPDAALAWLRTFLAILRRDRLAARMPAFTEELLALSRGVRRLQELLRDERRTAVAVVARPAAVPVLETRRLLASLRRLGVPAAGLIVNGLTCGGDRRLCARCRRRARRERGEVDGLLKPPVRGRRRRPFVLEAPLLAPPPRGAAALRAWAARWRILGA
jgi:arsenite-transporting ATPase